MPFDADVACCVVVLRRSRGRVRKGRVQSLPRGEARTGQESRGAGARGRMMRLREQENPTRAGPCLLEGTPWRGVDRTADRINAKILRQGRRSTRAQFMSCTHVFEGFLVGLDGRSCCLSQRGVG